MFLTIFLVKSKLSQLKSPKPQRFHEFFTKKKFDNLLGKSKLNFWTKNEDFEQCDSFIQSSLVCCNTFISGSSDFDLLLVHYSFLMHRLWPIGHVFKQLYGALLQANTFNFVLNYKMKLLLGSILIFNHAQTYAYSIPLSRESDIAKIPKSIKPKRIIKYGLTEADKKQATAIWVEKHRKTSLIKFKTPSLPLFKL